MLRRDRFLIERMQVCQNVEVRDDLLVDPLKSRLIEAITWMPVYFLNRKEQFNAPHEYDIHYYYPIAFSEDPASIDVEPRLHELDESLSPIREAWELVKATYPHPVRLYEVALSANTFGTEGRVHHDWEHPGSRPRLNTVLIYCVKEWDVQWAGDTLFFNEENEIIGGVVPKPGRVVKMRADPLHVGRAVSRICTRDRRVLTFKFWSVP